MPNEDQLVCIANNGYNVVVNLALKDSPGVLSNESSLVTALGMQYFHIPVIWEDPQQSDLDHFFKTMQKCQDQKVFVHCVLNMRVSVFVFLYRVMVLKQDVETANQDLLRIWVPDHTWQAFINLNFRS